MWMEWYGLVWNWKWYGMVCNVHGFVWYLHMVLHGMFKFTMVPRGGVTKNICVLTWMVRINENLRAFGPGSGWSNTPRIYGVFGSGWSKATIIHVCLGLAGGDPSDPAVLCAIAVARARAFDRYRQVSPEQWARDFNALTSASECIPAAYKGRDMKQLFEFSMKEPISYLSLSKLPLA